MKSNPILRTGTQRVPAVHPGEHAEHRVMQLHADINVALLRLGKRVDRMLSREDFAQSRIDLCREPLGMRDIRQGERQWNERFGLPQETKRHFLLMSCCLRN